MRDDRIGGIQDIGRGAIVLLQLECNGTIEIAQELLHVFHLGTAPAVDGLVIVADHEDFPAAASEHTHEGVLHAVGVLELIYQQMGETLLVVVQQCRLLQPQFMGAQQQLGKVDQTCPLAGALIGFVDADQRIRGGVTADDVLRAFAFIFGRVDVPGGLSCWPALFVQAELSGDALQQANLVVAVENLE